MKPFLLTLALVLGVAWQGHAQYKRHTLLLGNSTYAFNDWPLRDTRWTPSYLLMSYVYVYHPEESPYTFRAGIGFYEQDRLYKDWYRGPNVVSLEGANMRRLRTYDVRVGRELGFLRFGSGQVHFTLGVAHRRGSETTSYFGPMGPGTYEGIAISRRLPPTFGGLVGLEARMPVFGWLSVHPSVGYQAYLKPPYGLLQVGLHLGVGSDLASRPHKRKPRGGLQE